LQHEEVQHEMHGYGARSFSSKVESVQIGEICGCSLSVIE